MNTTGNHDPAIHTERLKHDAHQLRHLISTIRTSNDGPEPVSDATYHPFRRNRHEGEPHAPRIDGVLNALVPVAPQVWTLHELPGDVVRIITIVKAS